MFNANDRLIWVFIFYLKCISIIFLCSWSIIPWHCLIVNSNFWDRYRQYNSFPNTETRPVKTRHVQLHVNYEPHAAQPLSNKKALLPGLNNFKVSGAHRNGRIHQVCNREFDDSKLRSIVVGCSVEQRNTVMTRALGNSKQASLVSKLQSLRSELADNSQSLLRCGNSVGML